MLYIRMGLVMLISLYVSRVVLKVLGEDDYGIYNVVGGVVVMFSFLSRTLASASQRYFAFELGRGDHEKLNRIFNINLLLFCIVIGVIVVLAETVGLWFLHNKMTIPADRMYAANWIYQFSILSFCTNLIAIPYQAVIIAREKMHFYAFVGIMEALLNLAFALMLGLLEWNADRLIIYGALMLVVHIITNSGYVFVSRKRFEETKIKYYWEKEQVREIVSYSGWNLFGAVASVVRSQGINLLINVFFSPAINAARGLSYQVNNALNQFASNFYTAVRPQVTKYYAQGDKSATFSLVFSSSKYAYYLVALFAIPVLAFHKEVLDLWLADVPDHTNSFLILVLIVGLIDSISNPLMTLSQATGKVKLYQSVVGGIMIMNLPISWILLCWGYPAEVTLYVAITMSIIALFARLLILRSSCAFPVMSYCKKVLFRLLVTTIIAVLIALVLKWFFIDSDIIVTFFVFVLSVLFSLLTIYVIGFTKHERTIVKEFLSIKKRNVSDNSHNR